MGNQNSRYQSETAPDGSLVMRKPANKRLIIVAAAEPRHPVLFIDSDERQQYCANTKADYGHWK